MNSELPSLFIGSSTEGLTIAREVELQLLSHAMVTIWKDGPFNLGVGTLEALINALDEFDFAVMVLSPDDLLESRGQNYSSPRDNVLFELGLFMGRLGRSRTIILHERNADLKLPSDLAGITRAEYQHRPDNWAAGVSPACTRIIRTVESLNFFEGRQSERLNRATSQIEGVSKTVTNLIELLARSRSVELEIVERQFDPFISPDLLIKMKQDLADLTASLKNKDE